MKDLGTDPKLVADQLGHTLEVDLNIYTRPGLAKRQEALNLLESKLNEAFPDSTQLENSS